MDHDLHRRDFLRTAGMAASTLLVEAAPPQSNPFDKPMRWAQLTLVEDDPGKYSLSFWLDYFRRTHSDAACLSAGGCVAFYPTKVPLHYRSQWLGSMDPFGDLVAGCRRLDMLVIARTDPHAAHQDVFDAHPDWIAVDASGHPRRHWAMPELWVTCALGPYNFEFMTQVTKEIVSVYHVDGIFSNRWAGSGMCYCRHCQANFRQASGFDLPRTANRRDPVHRAYLEWKQDRLFELWRLWDVEIQKINPQARFIPNTGGGASSELDMRRIGQLAPTLFADRQARRALTPPWANGKNGKEFRSTMGNKAIVGIFSVGVEEPERWKDSVQSADEIRLWAVDGIANDLRPWFTKFSGTLHDKRWLAPVEALYNWHFANQAYLRNTESLARAAIVYSQQTAHYYGDVENHILGCYQALIESRIPFQMVHDRLLDPDQIDRYKVLILPNIAALSDRQCDQLRAYVHRGGSLVATYETSLYDEWGHRRADFGLADLFQANYAGRLETRMQNSYLTLNGPHPLLKGLEDAPRIINGANRVVTKSSPHPSSNRAPNPAPNPAPLTLIPSYPDLPMEEVFPRVPKTDIPEVFVNQFGNGRVVYFPWDIDSIFWDVLSVDHLKLLRNAVEWALDEPHPVIVKGAGVLDVTIFRQSNSMTVHLVNLTNPMMMKGPLRELVPCPPQQVSIRCPKPKSVKLLVSRREASAHHADGLLTLTVEPFPLHEVIALDL